MSSAFVCGDYIFWFTAILFQCTSAKYWYISNLTILDFGIQCMRPSVSVNQDFVVFLATKGNQMLQVDSM